MTRAERERLIERYMAGAMTANQESDFFIQVALDKELRQDLKAQRTIESAFRKDREGEPSEHTAMRSRVASVLAASSTAVNASASRSSAARNTPDAAPRASRFLRGRLASRPVQWALASAAALAMTVGAMILMPGSRPTTPTGATPGAVPGIVPAKTSPAPNGDAPPPSPGVSNPNIVPGGATAPAGTAPSATGAADQANYPPAFVNSDGAKPGSAARAPRRSAHLDARTSSANETISPTSRDAATHHATQTTPSADNPNGRASDPARPRRSGGDSIGVGARVLINRRH